MDIESDLRELDTQAQDGVSDLAPKVWAGIARRRADNTLSKIVLTWQSSVLAFGVVTSVAIGAQTIPATNGSLGVFSPHGSLAPSTLLSRHAP